MVGDAAGGAGEVWVRGGEEVQCYVRREDFGGERGGEKGGEAGLEDAEGCRQMLRQLVSLRLEGSAP